MTTERNAFDAAVAASAERVRASGRQPRIAVLLGSGWHGFVARVREPLVLRYAELPAFPAIGVEGHTGELVLGRIGAHQVAVLGGRQHTYEHGHAAVMGGAIATLAACGVAVLVQTNAAGSLDTALRPGALMLLNDHLNIVQASPLVGECGTERFVDLRDAYDPMLRAQAHAAARRAGAALHDGVYAWVLGPQFETPAEIRMLRQLGAHAVGMSTVPETILARRHGLRVLALSMITNMGCGLDAEAALSHAQTLAAARAAAAQTVPLLEAVVAALELT
ncbi:MAG: purine-nucleoside phosphorylase [Ideonella sp.]|nr:purine-nucleoside phosphorylase [Ideonella sp.]MCC7455890.1 purine-nucleoside phosphorylase [Nitrospira sp.]